MEGGLIGTDVSPIAAHLTSSSLAAIGVGEPYGDTQIGWINVKIGERYSMIGALGYFKTDEMRDFLDDVAGRSSGKEQSVEGVDGSVSVYIPDEFVDWILMNPPYSRTRKGQSAFDIAGLTEAQRKECQKEWGKAVKNEPANLKAGMAASFLALARRKVKPGGRIGFVLPLTAAFAETWAVTRRMVEREFTDITAIAVVCGKAWGKDNLSADTDMGEMILVATRRTDPVRNGGHSPVKCVTLNAPVTRPGEAGEIARAISKANDMVKEAWENRPIIAGKAEIGQVCVFDAGGEGAPWGPLGVVHAGLASAADKMACGRFEFLGKSIDLNVDMTIVKELFRMGPTHHLVGHLQGGNAIGAFELFPVTNPADAIDEDRSLWKADCEKQCSLVVPPTHKGVPVDDEKCREMRARRSRLFYARGIQWTSQALLAATTKHKAMGGSAWTGLDHDDIRVCKAFALWANSTLGLMVHWTKGQRTQIGRSRTQVRAISQMPCPKLDEIGNDMLDFAAAEFDRLASRRLLPTCQAHADEARWKIDSVAAEMLGLPDDANEIISELRVLWCHEPSVHGNNGAALAHLAARDGEMS